MRESLKNGVCCMLAVLMLATGAPAMALSTPAHSTAEMRQLKAEARAGDVSAMLALGEAYHYGRAPGFTSDQAWAVYWYGQAALTGNAEAETRLGDIYSDPEDKFYNEAMAFAWYDSAAGKGYLPAQSALARLWEHAISVAPDYIKAYGWYVKAAQQGDESTWEALDDLYVYGDAVTSYAEVYDRLAREAAAGDAEAQWRLGRRFLFREPQPDVAQGLKWLEISAGNGSAKGLYYFGAELIMGQRLPEDSARGMQMEKRAADMGFIPAQLYWAHNYPPEGQAPDTEIETMIADWWLAAAEKDVSEAQESLSYYYLAGAFVRQDRAEAWKWHLLSFRSPYRQLSWQRDIFPGPSEDEKVEGRRRADIWLAAHPGPYWPRPH